MEETSLDLLPQVVEEWVLPLIERVAPNFLLLAGDQLLVHLSSSKMTAAPRLFPAMSKRALRVRTGCLREIPRNVGAAPRTMSKLSFSVKAKKCDMDLFALFQRIVNGFFTERTERLFECVVRDNVVLIIHPLNHCAQK